MRGRVREEKPAIAVSFVQPASYAYDASRHSPHISLLHITRPSTHLLQGREKIFLLDFPVEIFVEKYERGDEGISACLVVFEESFRDERAVLLKDDRQTKVKKPNHHQDHEEHEEDAGASVVFVDSREHKIWEIDRSHRSKHE